MFMIFNNQNYQNLTGEMLKKERKYFMFLGILYVIGGLFALFTPLVSGSFFVMILGALVMILGAEALIALFRNRGDIWSKIFKFLIAMLYIWVGYSFFTQPIVEGVFLGIFGAFLFILVGIKKIILSFKSTGMGKNQVFLLVVSGILNLVLAGMILNNPLISILLIGIFISLELLTFGIIYIVASNHIKNY